MSSTMNYFRSFSANNIGSYLDNWMEECGEKAYKTIVS